MLFVDDLTNVKTQLPNGRWVIAKPLGYVGLLGVAIRIRDAWDVLTGKAIAIYFHGEKDGNQSRSN